MCFNPVCSLCNSLNFVYRCLLNPASMSFSRFMLNVLEEEEVDDESTWIVNVSFIERMNQSLNNDSHHRRPILNHHTINCNKLDGHNRLYNDYFAENPAYPDYIFRRRFHLQRPLFLQI